MYSIALFYSTIVVKINLFFQEKENNVRILQVGQVVNFYLEILLKLTL